MESDEASARDEDEEESLSSRVTSSSEEEEDDEEEVATNRDADSDIAAILSEVTEKYAGVLTDSVDHKDTQPSGLSKDVTLHDYQVIGFNWINALYKLKIGGILGKAKKYMHLN